MYLIALNYFEKTSFYWSNYFEFNKLKTVHENSSDPRISIMITNTYLLLVCKTYEVWWKSGVHKDSNTAGGVCDFCLVGWNGIMKKLSTTCNTVNLRAKFVNQRGQHQTMVCGIDSHMIYIPSVQVNDGSLFSFFRESLVQKVATVHDLFLHQSLQLLTLTATCPPHKQHHFPLLLPFSSPRTLKWKVWSSLQIILLAASAHCIPI